MIRCSVLLSFPVSPASLNEKTVEIRLLVSGLQLLAWFWIMTIFAVNVPEDKTANSVASPQSATQDREA